MKVYTFESSGPALIPESEIDIPSGPRMGWADALPTVGYWKVGDKLTIGSSDYVCTVEGSPGTWAPSGGGGGGAVITDLVQSATPTAPLVINGKNNISDNGILFVIGTEGVIVDPSVRLQGQVEFAYYDRDGINTQRMLVIECWDDLATDLAVLDMRGAFYGDMFRLQCVMTPSTSKLVDGQIRLCNQYISFRQETVGLETSHAMLKNIGVIGFGVPLSGSGPPDVPLEIGDLWFDNTDKKFKFFDGTQTCTITSTP